MFHSGHQTGWMAWRMEMGVMVLDEAPIFQWYRPHDLVEKRKGKNWDPNILVFGQPRHVFTHMGDFLLLFLHLLLLLCPPQILRNSTTTFLILPNSALFSQILPNSANFGQFLPMWAEYCRIMPNSTNFGHPPHLPSFWEEGEKTPYMCESIGHRPLWSRCPAPSLNLNTLCRKFGTNILTQKWYF